MTRYALILAVALPTTATADWVALCGADIRTALEGRVVAYARARQDFRASGKTLYTTNGRDSWGNWRVQDDQYCSQWPPSDLWACYDLERDGQRIRFVGAGDDDITEGDYVD